MIFLMFSPRTHIIMTQRVVSVNMSTPINSIPQIEKAFPIQYLKTDP